MKTMILIAFFALSLFYSGFVRADVVDINNTYQETAKLIEIAKRKGVDGYGGLYSNEIIINSNDNSWRAVGKYRKHIVFWYSDLPKISEEKYGSKTAVLSKIEVSTQASDRSYDEEWLFTSDKCVYYSNTESTDHGNQKNHYQYYLSNNQVIQFIKNKSVQKEKPNVVDVLEKAQKYKALFLKEFLQ